MLTYADVCMPQLTDRETEREREREREKTDRQAIDRLERVQKRNVCLYSLRP